MAQRITVYEVGPRDGLQNEARVVPHDGQARLLRLLADAGLSRIEATSFVSPRWIPELADAAEVVRELPRGRALLRGAGAEREGLERLARRSRGRRRGRSGGGRLHVGLRGAQPEEHQQVASRRPTRLRRGHPARARAGLRVRGYVSTAWGCPYEGAVAPGEVVEVAEAAPRLGCYQVSLGDTIGVGTPQPDAAAPRPAPRPRPGPSSSRSTSTTRAGTALANVLVGLEAGLATFDASVGGLGGCPYAPGASGNLATEDLVYLLHGMGRDRHDLAAPHRRRRAGAEARRAPASREGAAGGARRRGRCWRGR